MKGTNRVVNIIVLSLLFVSACTPLSAQAVGEEEPRSSQTELADDVDVERPAGWNEETHGDEASPDYEVVFPEEMVNEITISISTENWQTMLDDMTELYGEFGTRQEMGGQPGNWNNKPQNDAVPEGEAGRLRGCLSLKTARASRQRQVMVKCRKRREIPRHQKLGAECPSGAIKIAIRVCPAWAVGPWE